MDYQKKQDGIYINETKYNRKDETVFIYGWTIGDPVGDGFYCDTDLPIINKTYTVRRNSKGELYAYVEYTQTYDGYTGAVLHIVTFPSFDALYDRLEEEDNYEGDEINHRYCHIGQYNVTDFPDKDLIYKLSPELQDNPGSAEKMKDYKLYETSETSFGPAELAGIVSYQGVFYD